MSRSQRLLIFSGLGLLILAMGYGLWYAAFAEHQRLDRIGGSLATSFASAAGGDMQSAHQELHAYGEAEYLYVREVDAHSHWGGLAVLLILFGAFFDRAGFGERTRFWLATALSASSFAFPLSVLLQTFYQAQGLRLLTALISAVLIASMMMVGAGFLRHSGD
jgi:hypothetical protein